MQLLLDCPLCTREFDSNDHIPHMLPNCGHSLCKACLENSLSQSQDFIICPEDQTKHEMKDLKQYPVNQTILKILSKQQTAYCHMHNRKLELICLDDKQQICASCVLFGVHKSHHYKSLEEVVFETEERLSQTMQLYQDINERIEYLKEQSMQKEIREQFNKTLKVTYQQIEEHFVELKKHLDAVQEKVKEEAKQKVYALEQKFIKKQQKVYNEVIEKAGLWLLSTKAKLNEFASTTQISLELLESKSNMLQLGKSVQKEIEDYYQYYKNKLELIPCKQVQFTGSVIKVDNQYSFNILDTKKVNNSILQQSVMEDPNILKDQSFTLDVIMQHEYVTDNSLSNASPLMSPKASTQRTISQQLSSKKNTKLQEKLDLLLRDDQEIVDLSQSDIFDDAAFQISTCIENSKNIRVLKLMRNKISDQGAVKLVEALTKNNINAIHLQSNVITDKTIDQILAIAKLNQNRQVKCIYLNQNLISSTRCKKKLDELKKLGFNLTI